MTLSRFAALSALAFAIGAPATAQPAQQSILLYSFGYSPVPIHLTAGRPVTLTFVNRSGGGHDFTAKAFFANATITQGAAPNGEVKLRGGESRSITLIPRAGTYNVHCSHFLHRQMGMTGRILVN